MPKKLNILLIAALSALLMACGGSTSHTPVENPPAPVPSPEPDDTLPNLSMLPPPPTPSAHDAIPEGDRIFYVSPEGSDQSLGDEHAPFRNLAHAAGQAQPGDVIVLRGGVYDHDSTIRIDGPDGTAEKPIMAIAYPGETPIFDFALQNRGGGNHGLRLIADHWHLIGLKIRHAGHNGIRMDGSHNRLERLVVHSSHDTGINLSGPASHNLVMNCDSYHNFNTELNPPVGNRADGFGAKGGQLGPGNVLYGNRAWENSDDGFDFWEAPVTIVLYNNWTFNNGDPDVFGNPQNFSGAGNGFKLGGNGVGGDHIVYRNMAFDNLGTWGDAKGFDQNTNSGTMLIVHNTAYNNGRNFGFPGVRYHQFQNNVSFRGQGNNQFPGGSTREGNSWQMPSTLDDDDFLSLDTLAARQPRQEDGSLPVIDLLRPKPDSPLIDAGVDVGRPFHGAAPDIGAYEYQP